MNDKSVVNKKKTQNRLNCSPDATTTKAHARHITTLGDSGTTDMLIRQSDATAAGIEETKAGSGGHIVKLPNGDKITSIGSTSIRIPGGARDISVPIHIFADKELTQSLGSISAFTNPPNGCEVVFTGKGVDVMQDGKRVLHNAKKKSEKLWKLDIPVHNTKGKANMVKTKGESNLAIKCDLDADFVSFWHAAFGSPTVWTFTTAAERGYFGNLPRLTAKMIRANSPNTVATAKGHLDQTRQGQRSTKDKQNAQPAAAVPLEDNELDSPFAISNLDNEDDMHNIYTKMMSASDVNSSDLSGRFPVTSRQGWAYILFSILNGYIHYELMRSRTAGEYIRAFKATFTFFRERGANLRVQRLDNETSTALDKYLREEAKVLVEYLPPENHRANIAERAIRDGKNHLIAVLSTTNPSFPAELFDELIPQVEITLNLMRPCRYRPSISAYEGLNGKKFDFNAHPIAPCGTQVLVFETPGKRGTFAAHGVNGFYLGPALEHYRCFRCWVIPTKTTRITDTVAWFPKPYKMPGASVIEQMHARIKDLSDVLKVLAKSNHIQAEQRTLFDDQSDSATKALREVAALFSPPGMETSNEGSAYPARRAHPKSAIQRVVEEQPSKPPPPPPQKHTEGEGEAHDTAQRQPIQIGGTEQAHEAGLQRVKGKGESSSTSHTSEGEKQEVHEHSLLPNEVIRPPGKKMRASKPAAHTDRETRQNQKEKTAQNMASSSAIAAEQGKEKKTVQIPQKETDGGKSERGWALNLDAIGQPLTWTTAKNGPDKASWRRALDEEIIRLVRTSATLKAVMIKDIPASRRKDITYFNPQPKEKQRQDGGIEYRVRGAVGGDKINFNGPTAAQTADMAAVKILINSVVSDKAEWATADIKDFYLGTPLARPEYMRIQLQLLSDEVIEQLKLRPFIAGGSILFEIGKGMYGLPQAGLISQERLVDHLDKHGYKQAAHVPCLFRHATRAIAFSLVVDDFGIKYTKKEDLQHFITSMEEIYELKVDWTGSQYLGFKIKFAADRNSVALSLPGYVAKAVERFCPGIKKGSRSPAVYVPPRMGALGQTIEVEQVDDMPLLTNDGIKRLQEIIGVMLYYARAVDNTMLTAVNHIASEQSRPTQGVMDNAMKLLAYAAAYPNNELVLTACDMILFCQSDCSYLSRSGARSVAGGIEYLGNRGQPTQINGAIHAFSSIIPVVVASVAEGEYGAAFITAQHAIGSRQVLEFLGYPQPATLIMGDNECAVGLANNTIKIKRSKSIDMHFHWLRDRIKQKQFEYQWRKGANNLADFFTKALPVHKHQETMQFLVYTPRDPKNAFRSKHTIRGQSRTSGE